ncbi:uncharacterized protein LOC115212847 [Octopus sinensis]|uniref:Uncharacterized protein LOC115212847 n=1 Tax=Octopus sinensis TaxID=2607531 RepID=A0A6P7SGH3_9MOLL|nr:uncharacterized protein LOC115212847 [Octopus sinensis]
MVCRFIAVVLLYSYALQIFASPIPSSATDELLTSAKESSIMTRVVVGNVLQYYCNHSVYPSCYNCSNFIREITKSIDSTFPELHLNETLDFTNYDDFQMALVNMTAVISQYNTSIQSQLNRELNYLCAPARKIGVPCHYPNACFQQTTRNDAVFYCHLRDANSRLKDLKLLLSQMVQSYALQDPAVDINLLVEPATPIIVTRWFSMVTLHHLQEQVSRMKNKLLLVKL